MEKTRSGLYLPVHANGQVAEAAAMAAEELARWGVEMKRKDDIK